MSNRKKLNLINKDDTSDLAILSQARVMAKRVLTTQEMNSLANLSEMYDVGQVQDGELDIMIADILSRSGRDSYGR